LISNDRKDLDKNYNPILIESDSSINPSSYKIRSFAQSSAKAIRSAVNGFHTIIVIANLAGKAGPAIAPIVCREAKLASGSTIISLAIMPFKFEKRLIFQAGISLKRLRDLSSATVVIDSDAILEQNPDLSSEECIGITDEAVYEFLSSISKGYIEPDMSLLYARRTGVANTEPYTKVSDPLSASNNIHVHLMPSTEGETRFDRYDPISLIIPKENVLDWDEMDSYPDIDIKIPNLE
jgi:cell division protein FtsZ